MAGVFLSYDRDDTDRARHFARVLEKAGHSVWWDLHVRGGAQFSKVIEEALKAADVVVVLWSANSVESAWVRDEAAAGRDTGRLVPVTIDGTEPPLGFRQFQTLDLSKWRGRGEPPALSAMLADIEAMGVGAAGETSKIARPPAKLASSTERIASVREIRPLGRRLIIGGMALTVLIIIVGVVLARSFERNPVLAVAVTAQAGDAAAQPFAHDLLVKLGDLRSVQRGSVRLLGNSASDRPDLLFEASSGGANDGANLVLKGKDHSILWSKEFAKGPGGPAETKQQMAFSAEGVLRCAAEALETDGKALRAETLKLYLTGCSQFAEVGTDDVTGVAVIFRQVVKDAPSFKAGWAKLLVAESAATLSKSEFTPSARKALQQDIDQARRIDPAMPEAIIAQTTLLPESAYGETLRLLDRAHVIAPENTTVLIYRTEALMKVGRLSDALADAKQAVDLDTTSPDVLGNYILTLAYSGRTEAAQEQLRNAERMWPGTGKVDDLEYAFELRFGDPKELLKSPRFNQGAPLWQTYLRTRADPTPANVDRFIALLHELYNRRGLSAGDIAGHAQTYGELHRENDLYDLISRLPPNEDISLLSEVVFRPALHKFRQDARFMGVAKRIGLVDYWTRSGNWPDFCFTDPDQPYDCKKEAAKLNA